MKFDEFDEWDEEEKTMGIYARLDLDPVRESVDAATKAIFNAANKRLK